MPIAVKPSKYASTSEIEGRSEVASLNWPKPLGWLVAMRKRLTTARRGLAYLQADVSADRVRLLAAPGRILGHTQSYEAASEVLREASVEASQLSERGLEATLLVARSSVNLTFLQLREALADALSSQRSGGSALLRNAQLAIMLQVRLDFGHMDEVLRISEEIESLAKKVGHSAALVMSRRFEIWAEFGRVSDLTRYQTDLRRALQSELALGYGGVKVYIAS